MRETSSHNRVRSTSERELPSLVHTMPPRLQTRLEKDSTGEGSRKTRSGQKWRGESSEVPEPRPGTRKGIDGRSGEALARKEPRGRPRKKAPTVPRTSGNPPNPPTDFGDGVFRDDRCSREVFGVQGDPGKAPAPTSRRSLEATRDPVGVRILPCADSLEWEWVV